MRTACFLIFSILMSIASFAQVASVTVSGAVRSKSDKSALPYVNIVLKTAKDSVFVAGTVTNEEGRFSFTGIAPGNYALHASFIGYETGSQLLFVGSLSEFLDIPALEPEENATVLQAVVIIGEQSDVSYKMDKKIYSLADNLSQAGGSVLQSMQNLPGVTVQEGRVLLRGNEKVTVLIDGKQTALTGFGNQAGLDNIPASAIEKIEIITNLILVWSVVLFKGEQKGLYSIDKKAIIFLVISGIATGLSCLFYFKALQLGNASQVAAVDKMSVALTIVLAVIFLNETLTLRTALGALLIISGTFILIKP